MSLVVFDSNAYEYPALTDFLRVSPRNMVIVPDMVLLEAFRGEPGTNISAKFGPLLPFADQVVLLKPGDRLIRLHGRRHGLQKRLYDRELTGKFPLICQQAEHALQGDPSAIAFLERFSTWAMQDEQSAQLASEVTSSMSALAENYTENERKMLRQGKVLSDRIAAGIGRRFGTHIATMVFDIADRLHIDLDLDNAHIANCFLFRFVLLYGLSFLDQLSAGGFVSNPKKVNHEMADNSIAAAATFFDGFVTREARLRDRYEAARTMLSAMMD